MRNLCYLLLLSLLWACDADVPEPIETPTAAPPLFVLNYDGENETAPSLPGGGFYEGAIRLSPDQWADQGEAELIQVYVYFMELPDEASLLVYTGSDREAPVRAALSQELMIGNLTADSWNLITLDTPVVLEDEDVWVSLRFSHQEATRILGCDPGPAHPEGGWMYDSVDGLWQPIERRTNGSIDINWNIRAVVEP